MYKVLDITEHDFGCEGLPDGQEYYVDVILEDLKTKQIITVNAPDNELYKKKINVGSFVKYENNTLIIVSD